MPNRKTEQPWERRKGESAQAFEAFSRYLEMGTDRSIRAVSQELGKSKTLIDRWSRTYDWVERCRAWDNHLQREVHKTAIAEVREMTRRHTQLAVAIQEKVIKALNERGDTLITGGNLAAVVKLVTDLEERSRTAAAAAAAEDVEKAAGGKDGSVVKIICDIPRVQPAAPEEGGNNNDDADSRSNQAQ